MAASSSFSFFHPHVSYTASRHSRSNSNNPGKKCEMPCQTPSISVCADMRPRRRRRPGKNKLADAKGFEKSWPAESITADLTEVDNVPAPKEATDTSSSNQESSGRTTHSLILKAKETTDIVKSENINTPGYGKENSENGKPSLTEPIAENVGKGRQPISETSLRVQESDNGKTPSVPLSIQESENGKSSVVKAYTTGDDSANGSIRENLSPREVSKAPKPQRSMSSEITKPQPSVKDEAPKPQRSMSSEITKPQPSVKDEAPKPQRSMSSEITKPQPPVKDEAPKPQRSMSSEITKPQPSVKDEAPKPQRSISSEITKPQPSVKDEAPKPQRSMSSEITKPQPSVKDEAPKFDPEKQRRQIEAIALRKAADGSKIFSFPENLKAGAEVELFLNRSASSLAQEPTVKIRAGYNDWKWKFFEADLKKTTLRGDWWSCKLQIPNEAYEINFVFYNGSTVYENNSNKDFSLPVLGGLDKDAFEDFLIDEERKQMEKVLAERALEEKQMAEERILREKKAAEEADRIEAKKQAKVERERIGRFMQKAVKCVDGLWHFQPAEFKGGDTVKLFYNRANRSLSFSSEVWIHGGYNNWQDMVSIVGQLKFHSNEGGDWWTINVHVPKDAYLINWVMADGPPQRAKVYDNNDYKDFHAIVPKSFPADSYWPQLEEQIYRRLQDEREKKEEEARIKAQRTAEMKAAFKAKTKNSIFKSRSHIFYTDPIDVQAGKSVSVFYNPSSTVLNGKSEVWLRVSFNRWTHRVGCLPPIKMVSVEGNSFLKGTVKVPLDAFMMDFVFSERGDDSGGIYDNNLGMDYHVPVTGGFAKEPPMKVVHISVEMAPIAKVGGLGDVVTSLSRAVQELGHSVEIILPKYDCLKYDHIKDLRLKTDFFWGGTKVNVWSGTVEGLPVHFLEPQNGMFWVGCVYGRRDDGNRFGFFCHAALEYLLRTGSHPDIIHCHDWSSAPVSWLFKDYYKQSNLSNARIIFTIHNLEFGTALIGKAMAFADRATTVSETYAQEVSGNPAIAPHFYKFHGIRNGIDLDIWDPYNDPFIPVSYTSENVVEGKRAAKEELQSRLGLAKMDRPVVGIITRLTAQKGIHLIKHAIWKTLDRGGQVVLLGSAPDPRIQNDFTNLANQLHNSCGDMARLCLHYDEPLSHLIYAGADFILIPSMFEPCGLTQLIAMRYGAIPVVRKTGGLNDTVFDVDHDKERAAHHGFEPNGFSFEGTDAPGLDYALNRAITSFYDARVWFNNLCKHAMEQDWSWNRPALDYMELYYSARK